jgi:hypothetical protein
MLLEQSEPKKGDRKTNVPIFDSAVPLMRKTKSSRDDGTAQNEASASSATEPNGLMKFMLLTKKGNKNQVRRPIESNPCTPRSDWLNFVRASCFVTLRRG